MESNLIIKMLIQIIPIHDVLLNFFTASYIKLLSRLHLKSKKIQYFHQQIKIKISVWNLSLLQVQIKILLKVSFLWLHRYN